MEHFSHPHLLLLNEDYDARDGEVCYGCQEQIVPCKSFVYSCIRRSITGSTSTNSHVVENEECLKFFLHKTCAELPKTMVNPLHKTNPWYYKEFLTLYSRPSDMPFVSAPPVCSCKICGAEWKWFTYNDGFVVNVCLKCALYQVQSLEHRKIYHPAHTQHRLTLVQRLSVFKCDVCKLEDNIKGLSYICTKCPFWMHKSCADAPTSFQFQFHNKHPLKLSYSLPQVYHKFPQHCRLCNKTLPGEIIVGQTLWLYYCAKCRFFVHFQCARSRRMLSSAENEVYPNLVHLPAADESSVNLLFEEFVKAITSLNNNSSVLRGTNRIKHWTHSAHYLQLITTNDLTGWTDYNDDMLLLCDGCVKPIRTSGDLFYCCIPCKYFLHKTCAELPKKIEHHLWPGKTVFAAKYEKPYTSFCSYRESRHTICL